MPMRSSQSLVSPEQAARGLLLRAWRSRRHIWNSNSALPIPVRALITDVAQLTLDEPESLPSITNGAPNEVPRELGGYCDRLARTIGVAARLREEVKRFTLAHELGHWYRHETQMAFRELPRSG